MTKGISRLKLGLEELEQRHLLAADPITIMPIGDSISSGLAPSDANRLGIEQRASYRPGLWDLIHTDPATPVDVEFVGTTTYNPGNLPPAAVTHASYRGFWTLSFFPHPLPNIGSDPDGVINNNLTDADGWGTIHPDIALILLGTNDLLGGRSIGNMAKDLKRMIVELRADRPDVDILLGTLPPYDPTRPQANLVPTANDTIRGLANPIDDWVGSTQDSPIYIVDHYSGMGGNPAFDLALHSADGVHPNSAGDALLAANWWYVLEPLLAAAAPSTVAVASTTVSVNEGDVGPVEIIVTRTGDTSEELSVAYAVSGSATSGEDYVASSQQFVFSAGSDRATIEITVIDDGVDEPDESIVIQLQESMGYELAPEDSATIVVVDNDLPMVSISGNSPNLFESDTSTAQFIVTRDGDLSASLTVYFDLSGTATVGADYLFPGDSIVIPAGERTVLIEIAIKDDSDFESVETIFAELRDDSLYTVAGRSDSVLLADDGDFIKSILGIRSAYHTLPFRMS